MLGNPSSTIGLPLMYILDANANVRLVTEGAIEGEYLIDTLNEVLASPYGPE